MAERYSGKYSPGEPAAAGTGAPRRMRRSRAGGRSNLLFVVPFLFAIRAFWQPATGLALNLAAFGILLLAAWLTREGLLAQDAYDSRRVARRPAIPRKIFGSVLTGAGLGLAGFATGAGPVSVAIFTVLGTVLHGLSFGLDPMKDKVLEGIDTFQQDRVARVVDEAEKHLTAMREAIRQSGDRALEARVEQFQATARAMFRTVENDPRDLTAARKYLGVYLLGARDATIKFAELWSRKRDPQIRVDYEALLGDLESNFSARTQKLLLDDRADLNIEIEVLRERLEREGLRAN